MTKKFEVIIAGAGPVGLFLASELGLAGVSVLVLERDESPRSPWKALPLGLRGLNTQSVEAFYRRGLLGELFEPGEERPMSIEKTSRFQFAGHFAGMMLDANKVDFSRWRYRLPGPSLLGGPTHLERVEAALSARAERLGVTILRGRGLTSFVEDDGGVTVQAGEAFRAAWLVGCDGGRSQVRKAAGFELVGSEASFTGYVTMCELDDPNRFSPGFHRTDAGMYIVGGQGQLHVFDFDGGAFDRSQAVSREHFQAALRRVSGTDVTVTALHLASSFTDRAKQATTYRRGRVLLAGDSAHIHSPLGAQGLNLGIVDAMNLGWKLAATVKGSAPHGLLDTYTEERHPVGARVLEWSRAQVATLRPDLEGRATARLVQDLIATDDGTSYFVDRIWGLSQRYDLGDEHPLVGRSAPDFELEDGTRLGCKLVHGRGVLVDFASRSSLNRGEAVDYLDVRAKDTLGLDALLVRPDGVVAWVAEGAPDLGALDTALERWFGARSA